MTILDAIGRANPNAAAVADDVESLTYGQLHRQARQVATVLSLERRGRYFVLRAMPTARFVTTLLGIMYSGNVPVPVDPELPLPAVDRIARRCGPAIVIDPLEHADFHGACPSDQRDPSLPALRLPASDATEGQQDAIVSHASLTASCHSVSASLDYARHSSAAVVLAVHERSALISQVCAQLMVGGHVHLFRDLRDPIRFCQTVNAEELATFFGRPSTFHELGRVHAARHLAMPTVRVVCVVGGGDHDAVAIVPQMFPSAALFDAPNMPEEAPWMADMADGTARQGHGDAPRL